MALAIKTKLETNDDIMAFLSLIDCCRVAVESQYRAGQYSQENYDTFSTLIHRFDRIQQAKGTYLTRYLSQKEKNYLEKCVQIGWQAAREACQAKRIGPIIFENILRFYQYLGA